MPVIHWRNNEEKQAFEGVAQNHNLYVEVQTNIEHVVHIASVEPRDGSGPRTYAPHAFKELQDAQAWCEQEIERRSKSMQSLVEEDPLVV